MVTEVSGYGTVGLSQEFVDETGNVVVALVQDYSENVTPYVFDLLPEIFNDRPFGLFRFNYQDYPVGFRDNAKSIGGLFDRRRINYE